ncbi:MAG: excisionase family DNA-binding protein [Acidobacteria bacterium]|nr:excisionase family DNA-binding protein [Acidobacteriota bacterium]
MSDHRIRPNSTFDRKEAARRLGVSIVTIDRELARGRLPHFRCGRRVLFTSELLERYIHQNTKNADGLSSEGPPFPRRIDDADVLVETATEGNRHD